MEQHKILENTLPRAELRRASTLTPMRPGGFQMFRLLSTQSIAAGLAAALIGGCAAFLTPIPPAAAHVDPEIAVQRVPAKADRLPRLVTGSACSAQSWPSFDQKCQFDLRRSADDVRQVRVVSLNKR